MIELFDDNCGEVDAYHLVQIAVAEDFSRIDEEIFGVLKRNYEHVMSCESCTRALGGALEEFATGNVALDLGTFHKNLAYLDNGNGHEVAPNKI
jgi:hypothetical protein